MANQHVVPHENWRAVRWEWKSKVTKVFDTQKKATKEARKIAKNNKSELLIHWKNWKIRERDSYWNDPYPPRG